MQRWSMLCRIWAIGNSDDRTGWVRQPYLTVYRVKCERAVAEDLRRYRDVRPVDLPPRIGLERGLLAAPVQDLAEPASPPPNSPAVGVLDTGIVDGHPVLAPAVGDGQSFLPDIGADDRSGHGPSVSSSALYDDVAECLRNRRFVPEARLYSSRVLGPVHINIPTNVRRIGKTQANSPPAPIKRLVRYGRSVM